MSLIRNFAAQDSNPNEVILTWDQPVGFNDSTDQIIITKTSTHFPMELFNNSFPTKATDPRGVEIFRGQTIAGITPGTISVVGQTLTDTSAAFPTNPSLVGRLLRDANSEVFRIVSNTATSVTVASGSPLAGTYVILADFPTVSAIQLNFEIDIRTVTGPGFIQNLVQEVNGSLLVANFLTDSEANLIFVDGNGSKFLIKSNTSNTLFFFDTLSTPVIGTGMAILPSFNRSSPLPYIDDFKNVPEAAARLGTGLQDNLFYYYTGFTLPLGANVAQAQFSIYGAGDSTQVAGLSTRDRQFGTVLYNYWASLYRELDTTGDLQDLMSVFGFQFNQLHSLIDTYNLQDPQTVFVNALLPLSEQFGLPPVGFAIGIDTLRRIAKDMITCWKLKGSKQGIAEFIRMITTWDVTNGTGDFSGSISDFLPNVEALRFYDSNLGNTNTRITQTNPFVAGGRFAQTLPGIVIPGFFTFREFVVTISNVALYLGTSTAFTTSGNTTTMTDSFANFGAANSLIGNFLLPNQAEVNDIFEIISNTSNSITVKGIVNDQNIGGNYAVLSPLNTNRFKILINLLPEYIPFGTVAGFLFT